MLNKYFVSEWTTLINVFTVVVTVVGLDRLAPAVLPNLCDSRSVLETGKTLSEMLTTSLVLSFFQILYGYKEM